MARALVNVLYIERIYVLSSNNTSQTYSCAHIRLEKEVCKEEGIDQFYERKLRKLNFPVSEFISRFSFIWAASNVSPVQVNPVLTCLGIEKGNYARSLVTAHCCESLYV